MLSRLLGLFRTPPLRIDGVDRLEDGQSRKVDIGDPLAGGKSIVLARRDGTLYAVDRACPHEGGRIIDGPLVEGRYLVCPLHNYRFDPATGDAVGVACSKAKTYRVRERDGAAEIWI